MSTRGYASLSLVLFALILAVIPSRVGAQAPIPTFFSPPVFNASGLAFAVFAGGTVEQLEAAAAATEASGVWAQDNLGAPVLLVVGRPAFLTQPFRTAIPNGFSGATAVTLIRSEIGRAHV